MSQPDTTLTSANIFSGLYGLVSTDLGTQNANIVWASATDAAATLICSADAGVNNGAAGAINPGDWDLIVQSLSQLLVARRSRTVNAVFTLAGLAGAVTLEVVLVGGVF
jgi:hypothetical protein